MLRPREKQRGHTPEADLHDEQVEVRTRHVVRDQSEPPDKAEWCTNCEPGDEPVDELNRKFSPQKPSLDASLDVAHAPRIRGIKRDTTLGTFAGNLTTKLLPT